jgi:chemotaxis protein MotB
MAKTRNMPMVVVKVVRKEKAGHHNNSAWKVAYADFVTAMMAFFLLLWLYSVTTPTQKRALAEYFTPTIGIRDSMGIGFNGGKSSAVDPGPSPENKSAPGFVVGQTAQGSEREAPVVSEPAKPQADTDNSAVDPSRPHNKSTQRSRKDRDNEDFMAITQTIGQALQADADLKEFHDYVKICKGKEGLNIDLIDDAAHPLFAPDSADLTLKGEELLAAMASLLSQSNNAIAIIGHTESGRRISQPGYTPWELSADRANAARRFLVSGSLEPKRIRTVSGVADREPLPATPPADPRNRRITLQLIRGIYFDADVAPTMRTLLSVPVVKNGHAVIKEAPPPKTHKEDEE